MHIRAAGAALALSLLAGCAVSPETAERRAAVEADITDILSLSVDEDGNSLAQDCLREVDYRNFRALDDRYILFEGRGDKRWVNKLRTRCLDLDLRPGSLIAVRSFSSQRICANDSFVVSDWFGYPWYRRAPWQWGSPVAPGVQCVLGKFVPVSEDQLAEIEAALERK
jgi:hypothetical protein